MNNGLDTDIAIALRRVHAFSPSRLSAFEDPADEKSAHGSQRYSALKGWYEGRDPSWYRSVVRGLAGARRVLDLGAGPGLAMSAFEEEGAAAVLGVDRWLGFQRDGEQAGRRIIAHDLTLPMPFLRTGAFDGIFSHFALDYISPIGVLQVMREARRLLEPGGKMKIYLAAVGAASGDVARTTPYDETAVATLVEMAGFTDFETERPDPGRNTVAEVRQVSAPVDAVVGTDTGPLSVGAGGELQVAAGIRLGGAPRAESPVTVEVSDGRRTLEYEPSLTPRSDAGRWDGLADLAICARLVRASPGEFELQAWTWTGSRVAAIDTVPIEIRPSTLRLRLDPGTASFGHCEAWRPEPPMLERPGDPYASLERAARPHEGDGAWEIRSRRVVVERAGDDPGELGAVSDSKEQYLVRRPGAGAPGLEALDRAWLAGEVHGIVLDLGSACGPESLPSRNWAEERGALIYLEAGSWAAVERGADGLLGEGRSPLLLVDPALSGGAPDPGTALPEAEIDLLFERATALHLVLAPETAAAADRLCDRHPTRVLIAPRHGAAQGLESVARALGPRALKEATENLRYLTERTTLMRLRSTSGLSHGELGRLEHTASGGGR